MDGEAGAKTCSYMCACIWIYTYIHARVRKVQKDQHKTLLDVWISGCLDPPLFLSIIIWMFNKWQEIIDKRIRKLSVLHIHTQMLIYRLLLRLSGNGTEIILVQEKKFLRLTLENLDSWGFYLGERQKTVQELTEPCWLATAPLCSAWSSKIPITLNQSLASLAN